MTESSSHAMDCIRRWLPAASWAVEAQRGAAAAFCMMFALCLQRPSFANSRCVEYVRPRIWQVTTSYGTSTQKSDALRGLRNRIALEGHWRHGRLGCARISHNALSFERRRCVGKLFRVSTSASRPEEFRGLRCRPRPWEFEICHGRV